MRSWDKRRPLTASLVAILKISWCPIVSGTDDSLLSYQHASHSPLHAIASLRGERGQPHKILIPVWPQPLLIGQIQLLQGLVEAEQRRCLVDQADLCTIDHPGQAIFWIVQMCIIAEYELFKTGRFLLILLAPVALSNCTHGIWDFLPGFEPLPAQTYRCIDTDQEEGGSPQKLFQDFFLHDVTGHPPTLPSLGNILKQMS